MLDMVINIIGGVFFILGFFFVIAAAIFIMSRKDEEPLRHDQYYR